MRVTTDNPDYRLRQARSRRRLALWLFGIFLTASLFALLFVLQRMSIRYPPDLSSRIAEVAGADAYWTIPTAELPGLASRYLDGGEDAEAIAERLESLVDLLHPEAVLLVYERKPESGAVSWVFCTKIRRPQKAFHEPVERLLGGEGGVLDDGAGIETRIRGGRVLISNDRSAVRALDDAIANRSEYVAGDDIEIPEGLPGPEPGLGYYGPWRLLPADLRNRIAGVLPETLLWSETDPDVQLEWTVEPLDDETTGMMLTLTWYTLPRVENLRIVRVWGLELFTSGDPEEVRIQP